MQKNKIKKVEVPNGLQLAEDIKGIKKSLFIYIIFLFHPFISRVSIT